MTAVPPQPTDPAPSNAAFGAQYVHHIFAGHDKRSTCPDCTIVCCEHCETWGYPGEDHSCPCPNRDGECPDHPPILRIETVRALPPQPDTEEIR